MTSPVPTIAALATPAGRGALAMVRLSGPEARKIVRSLIRRRELPPHRQASLVRLREPESGADLGAAILTLFAAPRSFTGEDLVEIVTYGGLEAPRAVLEAILARGARPAEPGEFTRRALMAGRMSLDEVEGLLAVTDARTRRGLAAGLRSVSGGLGRWVEELRGRLLSLLAEVEAGMEFPEDEVQDPHEDQAEILAEMNDSIRLELDRSARTELAVDGIRTVILGPPNAGKSSLFNQLLGRARAITDPEPGTTRDTLEAELALGGHRIILVDTAGLRRAAGPVETEGVRRSLEEADRADLCLVVADGAADGIEALGPLLERLEARSTLRLLNKIDRSPESATPGWIPVSALTGQGLEMLEEHLVRRITGLVGGVAEGALGLNLRQRHALTQCVISLEQAAQDEKERAGPEIVALGIREALVRLGELTGVTGTEELLDEIFRRFCIGK